MDLPTLISRTSPFPILGMLGSIYHFPIILIQHYVSKHWRPDQTRCPAASDLGLRCWNMRHKKMLGLYGFNIVRSFPIFSYFASKTCFGLIFVSPLRVNGLGLDLN